ncbi:peptide/nickel transport system substrate-binding protein [Kribbella rubisoli]|uniref:Peptide/nickel transport system substrate-binding protein n=1 Tax=Kribbella rubisoli TaxID=3075929 RepID=A0A4Q7WMM1_9ACTN|nr:ABC transporter substrate-binding protein [Kribbella rubisoli]RZU11038.1 peptide/nickel transport system substrate-binding protein [Kribbella rubisoli]
MRGITRIAVAAIAVGALTAGCGGGDKPIGSGASSANPSSSTSSGGSTGQYKKGGSVTIANVGGQTWPCQFNPFNPSVNGVAGGFVYEPLTFVNVLKAGATTPMLATDFAWSPKKDSIVFTIRDGVKWSDGQPFSADDVVYTFNLMKAQPALDIYALWTGAGLTSVTAAGNKVTLKFKGAAEPYFFNFANQVNIVPKHIWSTGDAASKPATWADPKPVGTGPYTVESCSPNNISYSANQSYWQPGKPYIQKVQYPAYLDNNPANLDLASGKAQWGGQYIPNIDKFYKSKSPENNYWFPPTANVALVPNNDPSRPATSKLAVRQALAYALDREQISKIGESGYQPAANQTGVVTPTFDKYFDKDALAAAGYDKPNLDKAKQLLQTAGYSESNPLKLNVITVTGYTDWDASLAVVKQQLAKVGVELSIQDLQQQSYNQKLYTGDYDLAYSSLSGGPTPYYELRQLLYSKNTAPIGKQANSNYSRYSNPEVDKLFDQYASADPDTQVKLIKQISGYMIKDVPLIPTTESVDWYQYNTKDIEGWPTQDNPYAQPAPYNIPDAGQVLANLYSKAAQK